MARVTLKPSEMSYPASVEYKELLTDLRDAEDRSIPRLTVKALLLIGQELNGIRIRMK